MRKFVLAAATTFLVVGQNLLAEAQPRSYPPPYAQGNYRPRYDYGEDCRDQNGTAGAVLGAILGGLLGSQMGSGSGRAVATIGGVILGGVAGNAIARDIDCRDRPYAFRAYSQGFDGPIGHDYAWQNDRRTAYGTFRPTREYRDGSYLCRDFQDDRFIRNRHYQRQGTACRHADGNWYFR